MGDKDNRWRGIAWLCILGLLCAALVVAKSVSVDAHAAVYEWTDTAFYGTASNTSAMPTVQLYTPGVLSDGDSSTYAQMTFYSTGVIAGGSDIFEFCIEGLEINSRTVYSVTVDMEVTYNYANPFRDNITVYTRDTLGNRVFGDDAYTGFAGRQQIVLDATQTYTFMDDATNFVISYNLTTPAAAYRNWTVRIYDIIIEYQDLYPPLPDPSDVDIRAIEFDFSDDIANMDARKYVSLIYRTAYEKGVWSIAAYPYYTISYWSVLSPDVGYAWIVVTLSQVPLVAARYPLSEQYYPQSIVESVAPYSSTGTFVLADEFAAKPSTYEYYIPIGPYETQPDRSMYKGVMYYGGWYIPGSTASTALFSGGAVPGYDPGVYQVNAYWAPLGKIGMGINRAGPSALLGGTEGLPVLMNDGTWWTEHSDPILLVTNYPVTQRWYPTDEVRAETGVDGDWPTDAYYYNEVFDSGGISVDYMSLVSAWLASGTLTDGAASEILEILETGSTGEFDELVEQVKAIREGMVDQEGVDLIISELGETTEVVNGALTDALGAFGIELAVLLAFCGLAVIFVILQRR